MRGHSIIVEPPPPGSPTVEDLKAYREKHGCSLKEAVAALGWTSTRIRHFNDEGVELETPGRPW